MGDIKKFMNAVMLDLPEEELARVTRISDRLLSGFEELEAVDTQGVEPMVTVLDAKNVFREDAVAKAVSRDELLSNAPAPYEGYFRAPRTLSINVGEEAT